MTHNELSELVKSGDQEAFRALLTDFEGVIRATTSSADVDREEKMDLYQEGLIALYKAAMTYDPSLNASFSTYANVCIKHSIVSALRIYYGKKNYPIRSSLSLNGEVDDPVIQSLGPVTEPEQLLLEKESYRALLEKLDASLSNYEMEVLKLFLQGNSYCEISKRLNMTAKSVDNAIQRIRGKLKLII